MLANPVKGVPSSATIAKRPTRSVGSGPAKVEIEKMASAAARTHPRSALDPPAPLCPYGVSKLAAEYFFRFYGQAHGLDFMILRYGNVYGPRQTPPGEAGVRAILPGLWREGKPPPLYRSGTPHRD